MLGATIYDIAKLSGVSKSTVSRVLNNSERVSERVKAKVMAAVQALNYKPNGVARGLVLKRSNTIAVVVQDIRNAFYSFASWYAEKYFQEHHYNMVIYNADNDANTEREILDSIKYRRVDGVLSIGGNRDVTHVINFHLKEEIPVVLVDREVHDYDMPTVNLDNRHGGWLATEHLLKLGHTDILFATSDFNLAEMRRREGYVECLRKHGIEPTEDLILTQSEESWSEGVCPQLSALLGRSRIPSAVFASNDFKALQVIRVLKQHGLTVPDDVSVVGYDDIYTASIVDPPLTTVRQPLRQMIEAGSRLLLDIMGDVHSGSHHKVFKPELVERKSTKQRDRNLARSTAAERGGEMRNRGTR